MNPSKSGTKAGAVVERFLPAGASCTVWVRLVKSDKPIKEPFAEFSATLKKRLAEADQFYDKLQVCRCAHQNVYYADSPTSWCVCVSRSVEPCVQMRSSSSGKRLLACSGPSSFTTTASPCGWTETPLGQHRLRHARRGAMLPGDTW